MMFVKEEKVFSLAKTVATVPYGDLTALFSEFYCYLLVTGLFREGEGKEGIHFVMSPISDPQFDIPAGSYRNGLARMLSKGLKDRFQAILNHPDVSNHEVDLLTSLDAIFTDDKSWYARLTGRHLLSVAFSRNFTTDMVTVARYVAVAFGQSDYPYAASVPRLYLSVFGNIHLAGLHSSDTETGSNNFVVLDTPSLRYGSVTPDGDTVTVLWSLLSAQITSLVKPFYPGDYLGDMLSSVSFLTEHCEFEKSFPIPSYASSLYLKRLLGTEEPDRTSPYTSFYKEFLYGTTERTNISRKSLLDVVLNLMMEKMGESRLDHLFAPHSFYKRLSTTTVLSGKTYTRPLVLQFALEALDSDQTGPSEDKDPTSEEDDIYKDDNPEDASVDPSPISSPSLDPVGTTNPDKDIIGLISFDKSGEGVDEDLYRSAVMALNDKLQSDDTLPVSADVKTALDFWVNRWLYRAAISATKDQITSLKLQQHLKNVSTKG